MRVLIYKRTHIGDPDFCGRFGANDCMGRVRDYDFDAVIGIGGLGSSALRHGIAGKLNWIGIGPHKRRSPLRRASIVTFDYFVDFETEGPDFRTIAPTLAQRIYGGKVRYLIALFSNDEVAEIKRILALAKGTRTPSRHMQSSRVKSSCARTNDKVP